MSELTQVWREISQMRALLQTFDVKNVQTTQAHVVRQAEVAKSLQTDVAQLYELARVTDEQLERKAKQTDSRFREVELKMARQQETLDEIGENLAALSVIHSNISALVQITREINERVDALEVQCHELIQRMPPYTATRVRRKRDVPYESRGRKGNKKQ